VDWSKQKCKGSAVSQSTLSEAMPIVHLHILAGRSADLKARACAEVADALERTLAVSRSSIRVLITEVEPEHWSVGGVTKAAEAAAVQPVGIK